MFPFNLKNLKLLNIYIMYEIKINFLIIKYYLVITWEVANNILEIHKNEIVEIYIGSTISSIRLQYTFSHDNNMEYNITIYT